MGDDLRDRQPLFFDSKSFVQFLSFNFLSQSGFLVCLFRRTNLIPVIFFLFCRGFYSSLELLCRLPHFHLDCTCFGRIPFGNCWRSEDRQQLFFHFLLFSVSRDIQKFRPIGLTLNTPSREACTRRCRGGSQRSRRGCCRGGVCESSREIQILKSSIILVSYKGISYSAAILNHEYPCINRLGYEYF